MELSNIWCYRNDYPVTEYEDDYIEFIYSLERCDCGKSASWLYMPDDGGYFVNPFYCDDCVPRGCTCNHEYIAEEYDNDPPTVEPDGTWKWIEEGVCWERVDDKGRSYPCCEYDNFGEI